jgi:hypothetical protein
MRTRKWLLNEFTLKDIQTELIRFRESFANAVIAVQVLTAVVMKSFVFWDITPCSPLSINRRFGGSCGHTLHGRRINRKNVDFLLDLFFDPEMGATFCSKMSVDIQQNTWHYIREDRTITATDVA